MSALDQLRIQADLNRNQAYDHALSDLTSRVLYLDWKTGFDDASQLVAPPASGLLVLDNSDSAFSPNAAGAAYAGLIVPGLRVRADHMAGVDGNAPYLLMEMRVLDVSLAPGRFGPRVVTLSLGDWHAELMSTLYDPPLTLNKKTGVAAAMPFQAGLIPAPYAGSYWVLGASALDLDTRLYQPGDGYYSFYEGETTLQYVGDNLDDEGRGVSVLAFIEEMCMAEMDGRFWYHINPHPSVRKGYYQFIGRHTIAEYYTPANVFALDATNFLTDGTEYEPASEVCNALELTLYPRTVGAAGSELGRSASAFRLRPGESRSVTLRYKDPAAPEGSCGATTIIAPVASTDYTANSEQDGSGTDLTPYLAVTCENRTNAAYLTLYNSAPPGNSSSPDLYVTLLRVRGTPLTARQPVTVTARDAQSIHDYGLRKHLRTIAGVSDQELAQQYADLYVQKRKTPVARYRRVEFNFPEDSSSPLYRPALVATLHAYGITIRDEWAEAGASPRAQWIAGAAHVIDARAGTWRVTWALEDYVQHGVWRLGDLAISLGGDLIEMGMSRLDETTRLAF